MGTAGTDWGPSPRLSSRLRIAHPGVGPSRLGSCDCNQSISSVHWFRREGRPVGASFLEWPRAAFGEP